MIDTVLKYLKERKDLLEFELNDYSSIGDTDYDESVEAASIRSQIVLLEEIMTDIKSFT